MLLSPPSALLGAWGGMGWVGLGWVGLFWIGLGWGWVGLDWTGLRLMLGLAWLVFFKQAITQ